MRKTKLRKHNEIIKEAQDLFCIQVLQKM